MRNFCLFSNTCKPNCLKPIGNFLNDLVDVNIKLFNFFVKFHGFMDIMQLSGVVEIVYQSLVASFS